MQNILAVDVCHSRADVLQYADDGIPALWQVVGAEVAPLQRTAQAATDTELLHALMMLRHLAHSLGHTKRGKHNSGK